MAEIKHINVGGTLYDVTGTQGPKGDSGVYVGENEPTDEGVLVWFSPDNTVVTSETWVFTLSDGTTVEKKIALL